MLDEFRDDCGDGGAATRRAGSGEGYLAQRPAMVAANMNGRGKRLALVCFLAFPVFTPLWIRVHDETVALIDV